MSIVNLPGLVACAVATSALIGPSANAAPAADIVIAWASEPLGPVGDALAVAARGAGAAFVDTSPPATPLPDPRPLIRRGIAAYGGLELEAALAALDAAAELVDQTGAAALDTTLLGDLYVYRALTHASRGDDARSWDDLLVAATIDPTRVLDPAGFPPRVVERFGQARAQIAASPRGRVTLTGPARCRIRLDGATATARALELPFGRHWLDAACDGFAPVRRRLVVDRVAMDVSIAGAAIAPPDDTALLVQARTASARALVAVTVRGPSTLLRRIGVDGKEQDRITLATAEPREIATAASRLLAPPERERPRDPWYRNRWVWAGAGAVIAGAILVPFALRGDGTAPGVAVRPEGVPDSW